MLTSKERSTLRSMSNGLNAIIHVGKAGASPDIVNSVDEALEARELIKIDLLNNCLLEAKEAADIISERTRAEVVQVIGRKFVLFRRSKKKQVIEF